MIHTQIMCGLVLLWGGLLSYGAQPAPVGAPPPAPAGTNQSTASAPVRPDAVAGRFSVMCAGCHSLSGAKLNGPELTPATGWPLDQLKAAIKRMEKNVGPLPDDQVAALADFLKAPDVRERLRAEQERLQVQFAAKLAPPDAALGKRLFLGTEPLRNGGLACVACHAVGGAGGNLGKDLTGVFARMGGEAPLVSAIEQASFKVMAPHYKRHPVTRQEAMHLAKFFATLNPASEVAPRATFVPVGGGLALAGLLGLVFHLRRQRASRGREVKLQRRRK